MTAELLKCPFCGGGASCVSLGEFVDDEQNEREDFVVGCDLCHAVFPPQRDELCCTEKWNTRTPDLSFLDKPEVVERVQHAIHNELLTWDDGDPRSIHWRRAVAKAAIAAIKHMAKEGDMAMTIRNTKLETGINPHEYIDGSKAIAKAATAAIKDTVAGLELLPTQMGADYRATFSHQPCDDGFEVLMHFRGVRRFAFCTHENDASVIANALNKRMAKDG